MKKLFIFLFAVSFSTLSIAQGNGNNNNGRADQHPEKLQKKHKKSKSNKHDAAVADRDDLQVTNADRHRGKVSKNLPAKVKESFLRDYPSVSRVRWTKKEGNWTATFRNGYTRSYATYHANGNRIN